jgi:hypothetical protein
MLMQLIIGRLLQLAASKRKEDILIYFPALNQNKTLLSTIWEKGLLILGASSSAPFTYSTGGRRIFPWW